jgi:dTDP-4-amino-4,6-dideoxygalactose transaminase
MRLDSDRLPTSMMEVPCHQDLSLATMARIADSVREVLAPAGN